MTDLEAIELRQSRRTYLNTPIDVCKVKRLKDMIDTINGQSGLFIQFVEHGSNAFRGFNIGYGMFSGVQSYLALVGKTSDVNLKEKCGYYGELLVLEATMLGLGTCWVGGTFNRKGCSCTVHDDETLLLVITIGNVPEKKSLKENVIYKAVHHHTKSIEELYLSDSQVPDWFIKGIKAVQKAPSAINRQPVHFKYIAGVVTAEVANTESSLPIDLGIAKSHFEIGAGGKFELGNSAVFHKANE